MAKTFNLEVVTPTKHFFNDEVEMVMVNTISGYEGFMANHIYATKLLSEGKMKIKMPGKDRYLFAEIRNGYIDVKDKVLIFTERAVWTEI
jgi:F-type H+-transporting ATPase subunit epsilon